MLFQNLLGLKKSLALNYFAEKMKGIDALLDPNILDPIKNSLEKETIERGGFSKFKIDLMFRKINHGIA